jgi:hypothetical protein
MTELEKIHQEMALMREAIQGSKSDPATFDFEDVKDQFREHIDAMVAEQVKEQRAATPVFKGDPVYAHNLNKAVAAGDFKNDNRYAREIKEIAQTGKHKGFLGLEYKAVDFWLAHQLIDKIHQDAVAKGLSARDRDKFAPPSNDLKMALKALSSTGSGTGDELVPTNFASELWEDVHLANVLVSNLTRVPMTSNPQTMPNALGDVTFYKGAENVAVTASDPATSNQDLTVTELVAEVDWSYTLEEDAIVAMMPAVRQTLTRNAAEYMDGFAYRADSTATSSNYNTSTSPPASAWYLSDGQDGIVHQWMLDNTGMQTNHNAALTDVFLRTSLNLMGKYAANPRDLLLVMDINTYLMGMLDATTSNAPGTFLVDQSAVGYSIIVNGQIASYRGIPIVIPTMAVKTTTAGTISDTAASNVDGHYTILNRTQWRVGFLRDLLIEVDRDIQKRQTIMVLSFREAIGCRGTRSAATHTVGGYGVTIT